MKSLFDDTRWKLDGDCAVCGSGTLGGAGGTSAHPLSHMDTTARATNCDFTFDPFRQHAIHLNRRQADLFVELGWIL